jgi:hypothetical protein
MPAAPDRVEFRRQLAGARGRERDQRIARCRRGLPDLHAAAHDAAAAGGRPLVGCQRGVALDQHDALDADAKLLGGHLRNRDPQSLPEIDLPRIDRHRAVGVDRDEAVDVAGIERLPDRGVAARGSLRGCGAGNHEADEQRTAGLQKCPARQRGDPEDGWRRRLRRRTGAGIRVTERPRGAHVVLPAARIIARRMRSCVPHRHRLPASACCASSRVRCGCRASAAAPAITMPATQ